MSFQDYAKREWLNIGCDAGNWYVTIDPKWTMKTMKKEGWNVRLTGRTQMQQDDMCRHFFELIG